MPNTSRLTGRFLSVLISLVFAILLPRIAVAASGPTLCQITETVFGSQPGADKKAVALSFLQNAVHVTNDIGKSIVDRDKFEDGLSKVIDGVVECLNASVWAKQRQSAA